MWYNLSDAFELSQFVARSKVLIQRGGMVELTERRSRSLNANAYLHAIIAYLALQLGERPDYVKSVYYKKEANADLFVESKTDAVTGHETEFLRSSADLSEADFSLSIDRFRNWSADTCGVYLPAGDEHRALQRIMHDVDRAKAWLR